MSDQSLPGVGRSRMQELADKWWTRLPEHIRREVSVLDIEAIVADVRRTQFQCEDTVLHAAIPDGWSHEVLESQSPLPHFYSARVWRGEQADRVQNDVSPTVALALAIIEVNKLAGPSLRQIEQIAGLVNTYHNDGTTLTAAETLRAIADVLGPTLAREPDVAPPQEPR